MKNTLLFALIGMGIFATSCSTAYKTAQTPDDVYYSPTKEVFAKADVKKDEQYEEYISSADDRYLRMKVANNYRWGGLDDFTYWNDSRYDFNHYNNYNSIGWNFYFGNYKWNYWNYPIGLGNYYPGYSWGCPTHTIISYYHPKAFVGTTSESGINAYSNKNYNNSNTPSTYLGSSKAAYNNSNSTNTGSSNFGNLVKRVFVPSNSNSGNSSGTSYDRAVRTYDNGSSNSSRSGNTSTYSAPSSSAGGNSGGTNSTGSSASAPRASKN